MYCKHCGKQIADDSTFCQYCGGKVDYNTPRYSDNRLG
ncbi:MAG: zinc-ribbon domain-containing protein [Prevotella sp.]